MIFKYNGMTSVVRTDGRSITGARLVKEVFPVLGITGEVDIPLGNIQVFDGDIELVLVSGPPTVTSAGDTYFYTRKNPPPPDAGMHEPKQVKVKKEKAKSRSTRWTEAVAKAQEGLNDLLEIQGEFESWKDNLPENLQSSNLYDKLETVCDLDIQSALDTVEEADGADLPLGFGRD